MALYPEDATLQAWTKFSEAREFSGLPLAVFEALQARLGSLGDTLRNVAILPADVWTGEIAAARVSEAGERLLTPIEAAQARRLAKKAAFLQGGGSSQLFVDVDPFAPVQQGQGSPAQSSVGRMLKLSALVDQGTTPRSVVPRRSRWRPGTSSTSLSWGRHRRRRRSRLPTSCRRSIIAQWSWATRRTSIMRCGARLDARLPERTSFARGFPRATARVSPRNCQGPRISSSGFRRGGCSRLRPSCWT